MYDKALRLNLDYYDYGCYDYDDYDYEYLALKEMPTDYDIYLNKGNKY